MASCRPRTPSPLNPNRCTTKNSDPMLPLRSRALPKRPVSVSPTERLQRHRAAQAWRRHVLMEEARVYEKAMMEAIREREIADVPGRYALDERDLSSLGYDVKAACSPEDESEQQFQLPALSIFTPRRVALAVGLMKRLPNLKLWGRYEPLLPINECSEL